MSNDDIESRRITIIEAAAVQHESMIMNVLERFRRTLYPNGELAKSNKNRVVARRWQKVPTWAVMRLFDERTYHERQQDDLMMEFGVTGTDLNQLYLQKMPLFEVYIDFREGNDSPFLRCIRYSERATRESDLTGFSALDYRAAETTAAFAEESLMNALTELAYQRVP
jgi:hypothetical protein